MNANIVGQETLTPQEFTNLCIEIFGRSWGWQGQAAQVLGCSQSHISNIKTGKIPLSREHHVALLRHATYLGENQTIESIKKATDALVEKKQETDEEISDRLSDRQRNYELLVTQVMNHNVPSLIVSGPPGTGKSHTVKKIAKAYKENVDLRTGTISAVGLYKALFLNKDRGIVAFDDCDDVFGDQESLNLLKGALDSTEKRTICWSKNAPWLINEDIPDRFDFNGSVIFLTNQDMYANAMRTNKMAKHFEALLSRCLYLDLGMHSAREIMIKIENIAPELLGEEPYNFKEKEIKEMLSFMKENMNRYFQFSLREIPKLAQIYRTGRDWKKLAELSLFRK